MNSIIKNKKLKIKNSVWATLFAALVFSAACERRILEDDYLEYAYIPVKIDWSRSGISVEEMHRASVWLFPHDGKAPLEYRLETDLTYREIPVPVGIYSVLVFNETIDESDWNSMTFTGTEKYETFAARNTLLSEVGIYTRSKNFPLIGNPDAIAAWSLDHFEVTPDMVYRTRTLLKKKTHLIDDVPHLTSVRPLPRFERVVITAYVTNLASSKQATGTIDGLNSGVYLASGEKINETATQAFILNGRVYDGYHGTTSSTFLIFGRKQKAKNNLVIDFLLTNNEMHPSEEFDVTNLIVTEKNENVRTHIINIGYGNLNGDHPLNLPEGDMEPGITVDDWTEVIIPIK